MTAKSELQDVMYGIIIKGAILLSIFSIFLNIIFKLPLKMNIKWIVLGGTSLYCYASYDVIKQKFIYLTFMIAFFLPYAWFDLGGCINILPYVLLIMFFITFLFDKTRSKTLLILLLSAVFLLLAIEYNNPHLISTTRISQQTSDKFVQIIVTLLFGYLVMVQFASAYFEDKRKLKEANEKLNYYAHMDSLTNVHNRRAFDRKMEEILLEKKHLENEVWIIIADIDHFKKINDTYGHKEGDRIICQLADYAKEITSEKSFISRWGGDEFCLISQVSKEELVRKLSHYYTQIKKVKTRDGISVTVSLGITRLREDDNIITVFKRADSLLYNSKKKGRARYTIS